MVQSHGVRGTRKTFYEREEAGRVKVAWDKGDRCVPQRLAEASVVMTCASVQTRRTVCVFRNQCVEEGSY